MRIGSILAFLGITLSASAQAPQDSVREFKLGEVTIFADRYKLSSNEVGAQFIHSADLQRTSEALQWMPGVTFGETGGRGEASFNIRGIGSNNIPIYIDGIPMTAPYDGTIDVYRLGIGTLSKVDVIKSGPSLLLGGNTLGPSINLVTRQPQKDLEFHIDLNTLWHGNMVFGGRFGKFFAQTDLTWSHEENFKVPGDYKSEYINDDNERLNSRTKDFTWNTRLGFTPNQTDEYVLGYLMVRSRKNIPPYASTNGSARFWRYPYWNKDELYFHSSSRLGSALTLKTKFFYDTFNNLLKAYDDMTFTTQKKKSSWSSYYDDYALGANATLEWQTRKDNLLKLGANYKYDAHRSHNEGEPEPKISEGTYSFVLEDQCDLLRQLSLTSSVGYFGHKGYTVEEYSAKKGITSLPTSNDHNFNALIALDYHPLATQHLRLTTSRTSLFARMKDRYSYKLGKAIPNPDLETENALNLDLTYEGSYGHLNWFLSGYYNFINDIIQEVTGVDPEDPKIYQLQNKGKAEYRGFEVGLGYNLSWLTASASYTFVDQKNKDNEGLKFLYSPKEKVNAFLEIRPFWGLRLQGRMIAQSKAYSSSDGSTWTSGFARFDASLAKKISFRDGQALDLKVGVLNIGDRVYEFTEGYPQRGRTWYAGISFDL